MKNGHIVVNGKRADALNIQSFTDDGAMFEWEFAAYAAYDTENGKGACDRDEIMYLRDLFGTEFEKEYFMHKYNLILASCVVSLEEQINIRQGQLAIAKEALAMGVDRYDEKGQMLFSLANAW